MTETEKIEKRRAYQREYYKNYRKGKKALEYACNIEQAKKDAEYVIVCFHSHEIKGDDDEEPDFFIETFARSCIDWGASAVVGMVCEAITSGYRAFSATGLASIRMASAIPSTMEIMSPIATTCIVAGRCAVKIGPRRSHSLCTT